MKLVAQAELKREYRVLRQTLGIHGFLRDSFAMKAKAAEIILLVCSALFCATTFADDSLFILLGIQPSTGRLILGLASVVAFSSSLALLVLDWPGQAARHRDSAERWSQVLSLYRKHRLEGNSWPPEVGEKLDAAYWETDRNTASIPENRFTGLKARYLRKVEVSRLQSEYPGCPQLILTLVVRGLGTVHALRGVGRDRDSNPPTETNR